MWPQKHRSGNTTWKVQVGKKNDGAPDVRSFPTEEAARAFHDDWNTKFVSGNTNGLTDLSTVAQAEPRALVVSLDARERETPTANQMVEALSGMARQAGVDVFLHLEEAQTEWESAFEDVQRRAELRTALLDEVLRQAERRSYRDCGINE